MPLEKIEARNLNARVYRELKLALVRGAFEPGQVLIIRDLAEQLGTSPMPVRNGLSRLVSERALEEEEEKARSSVRVPQISREAFEDLRAARILVEGEAAFRAARHSTPQLVRRLEALHRRLQKAVDALDVGTCLEVNYAFHTELYGAARSPTLERIIDSLWLQSGPYFRVLIARSFETVPNPLLEMRANERIIEAMAANDGRAARKALTTDIDEAASFFLSFAPAKSLLPSGGT
jgi:DNA-binding GntR family transcriptional regulator